MFVQCFAAQVKARARGLWIVLVLFWCQGVVIFGLGLGWLCVPKPLCLIAQVCLDSLDWLYTYWLQSVQIYITTTKALS